MSIIYKSNKKKDILFVLPSLSGGGAERVTTNIINFIKKNNFNINILLINNIGPFKDLIFDNNINIINLNKKHARTSYFKLVKIINTIKPDIVFSTLQHVNILLLIFKRLYKSKPKLIIREANTPSQFMGNLNLFKKKLFLFLLKTQYKKADLIIAQCNEMRDDIISTYKLNNVDNVITIYNPIDVKFIKNKSTDFNPFNHNYVNIVSIGRLTYQKGFDILLKSISIVRELYPNVFLTIVGDGELRNYLIRLSNDLNIQNSVNFVGFQNNPYPYIKYSDLYVLSSRWEGFPNTLLEAITLNKKVVSTNCKSGTFEILNDYENGIIVKTDDPVSLAEGIISSIKKEIKYSEKYKKYDATIIVKEFEKYFLNNINCKITNLH